MSKGKGKNASNKKKQNQGTKRPKTTPQSNGITPDKIMWWSLHALIFAVPLAVSNLTFLSWLVPTWNIPLTFDQFDIVKVFTMRALVLIGYGAWAWGRLTKGGPVRRTKIDWIILVFLGWMALSTVTSIHPPTAIFGKYRRFEGLLSFITYAAVFWLTVQAVDRPDKMRKLARTLVISGFIVGLYGVSQYFGIDLIRWGNLPFEATRAFATYGNPDLLGGFLMFPLPISLAMAFSEKDIRWRWFYWVAFLTLAVAWIVSFVRGAWVGGAVGLVVLAILIWRKKPKLETPDRVAMGVTGAAAAAVVVRSLTASNAILNVWARIQSIFKFDQGSALTRFEIWDAAWRATLDRPITGFGADTFRLVFPKYKPIEYVADAGYLSVADNVHNYPLQMASAIGIPGVALLYAIFVRGLWVSAKEAFSREGGERVLLAGFWAATVGYMTHLVFGLSVTGSSVFLWFSMGILMVASAKTIEFGPAVSVWRTVAAGLIVVVIAVASFLNIRYIAADHQHLLSKIGVLTTVDRIEASKLSIERNPFNDMYRAELGLAYTELTISHINAAEQARAQGADMTDALRDAKGAFLLAEQAFLDVIDFVPPEYDNYVFLSNLYSLAGTYIDSQYFEDAVTIAEQGIEVEPFGPAVRVQGGRALIALGRYDEAIEMLTPAADMDPDYAEPRLFLAQAYFESGDMESTALYLSETFDLQPENPEALQVLSSLVPPDGAAGPVAEFVLDALAAEHLDDTAALSRAFGTAPAALGVAPEDLRVMRRAATVYRLSEMDEDAIPILVDMADLARGELYPRNIWPHLQLIAIYQELGDIESAILWSERSIEVDDWHSISARETRLEALRELLGE